MDESLAGLTAAFEEWRSRKRHLREAVPADLLKRARQVARRHGPAAVARATKVERSRLKIGSTSQRFSGGHERIHFRLSGGSIHGCGRWGAGQRAVG